MGYFLRPDGGYYEGDRAHALDLEVPQRPTPDHRWENGEWVVDAPEVLLDRRAVLAIDGLDRLQFEHLFNLENTMRDLKAKINLLAPGTYTVGQASQVTVAQYRAALIDRWKVLNP